MKVLVVDDLPDNRQLLTWILSDQGHEYLEAENGKQAVEIYTAERPDLILLDVMMPVMDGYEAARLIKGMDQQIYTPIIFLTALDDEESLSKCLESGGDDFLTKPFNEVILQSKINAHMRIRQLSAQIVEQNHQLTQLNNHFQVEQQMVHIIFKRVLKDSWKDCKNLNCFSNPASFFNGDLMLVAPSSRGGLYLLIGDFTGHGLPAAIGALPVSNIFFACTKKNLQVNEIVCELNEALLQFLPENMFFAAALVELNQAGDQLEIWSGGLMESVLISADCSVKQTIPSSHMPLGILSAKSFKNTTEMISVSAGDKLYIYTDGLAEAVNAEGEMFGEQRVIDMLSVCGNNLEHIEQEIKDFIGDLEQADDISLAELCCFPVEPPASND